MYCGSCGRPIADDAKFCMFCGWQVVIPQQTVPQVQPMQAVQPVQPVQQPMQAMPQMAPQMQAVPMQQPQYAQAPQVQPQYAQAPQVQPVQQVAPQPQAAPMQQAAPMSMGAGTMLEPICVSVITPKNAQKERIKLDVYPMYYVEITNNNLIISGKGGAASYMFGAVGALVTAAACDLKPILAIAPDKIRNMTYEKKFGDILVLEMHDGKLLQIKTKLEVLNTIENWWRSQLV